MAKHIDKLYEDVFSSFDAKRLLEDYTRMRVLYPDQTSFMLQSLTKETAKDMTTLYDFMYAEDAWNKCDEYVPQSDPTYTAKNMWKHKRYCMDTLHEFFKGTYTEEVFNYINEICIERMGQRVSQIIYHEMVGGRCYAMHYDMFDYYYHIPIQTTPWAFFIKESEKDLGDFELYTMPDIGSVYALPTNVMHSAFSAESTLVKRVHILFPLVDANHII